MINADKFSPVLLFLSYKSRRAPSHCRVDCEAPKIEEAGGKVAKLLIKLWRETLPGAEPGLSEDTQVPYPEGDEATGAVLCASSDC